MYLTTHHLKKIHEAQIVIFLLKGNEFCIVIRLLLIVHCSLGLFSFITTIVFITNKNIWMPLSPCIFCFSFYRFLFFTWHSPKDYLRSRYLYQFLHLKISFSGTPTWCLKRFSLTTLTYSTSSSLRKPLLIIQALKCY